MSQTVILFQNFQQLRKIQCVVQLHIVPAGVGDLIFLEFFLGTADVVIDLTEAFRVFFHHLPGQFPVSFPGGVLLGGIGDPGAAEIRVVNIVVGANIIFQILLIQLQQHIKFLFEYGSEFFRCFLHPILKILCLFGAGIDGGLDFAQFFPGAHFGETGQIVEVNDLHVVFVVDAFPGGFGFIIGDILQIFFVGDVAQQIVVVVIVEQILFNAACIHSKGHGKDVQLLPGHAVDPEFSGS